MRRLLEIVLAICAGRIVAKYRPTIIGITGSVGKTSTRAAVFAVVSSKYRAYTPPKNLNDKIGLPMGVIGMDSPGKSLLGWVKVFAHALYILIFKGKYPEALVLEYGIDRVGEMDELLNIAKPNIGILTSIGLSHYQFFESSEVIEQEKGKLVESVKAGGTIILNSDNEVVLRQGSKARASVLNYGRTGNVHADKVEEELSEESFTVMHVSTPSRTLLARIPAVGTTHVSSCLAAIAVAESLKIETDLVIKSLGQYKPVPGRLNVISGLKRSILIDDTYNSAPDSMHEALQLFARFHGTHKIAVLGDMLELGALSDEAHASVGSEVARIAPSHLITVGSGGKIIAESAVKYGYPDEQVVSFDNADNARLAVQDLIREGSVVLVKGSQGMRMEIISKEIMAEPMKAGELLCRQYGKWIK